MANPMLQLTSSITAPSLGLDSAVSPPVPSASSNQCVFVRGLRMVDRNTWFRRKILIDVGDGFETVRNPPDSKEKSKFSIFCDSLLQRLSGSNQGGVSAAGAEAIDDIDDECLRQADINEVNGDLSPARL
jgi:hypothetical protein